MDGYQPTPEERLQEAVALLARASGDLNEILALLNAAVGELIAGPDPPWAQIRPQPPPAAKFPDRVIRHDDQRTVMASGQLGLRSRHNITQAAPGGSGAAFQKMDGRCLRRAQPQAQRQVVRFDSHSVLHRLWPTHRA